MDPLKSPYEPSLPGVPFLPPNFPPPPTPGSRYLVCYDISPFPSNSDTRRTHLVNYPPLAPAVQRAIEPKQCALCQVFLPKNFTTTFTRMDEMEQHAKTHGEQSLQSMEFMMKQCFGMEQPVQRSEEIASKETTYSKNSDSDYSSSFTEKGPLCSTSIDEAFESPFQTGLSSSRTEESISFDQGVFDSVKTSSRKRKNVETVNLDQTIVANEQTKRKNGSPTNPLPGEKLKSHLSAVKTEVMDEEKSERTVPDILHQESANEFDTSEKHTVRAPEPALEKRKSPSTVGDKMTLSMLEKLGKANRDLPSKPGISSNGSEGAATHPNSQKSDRTNKSKKPLAFLLMDAKSCPKYNETLHRVRFNPRAQCKIPGCSYGTKSRDYGGLELHLGKHFPIGTLFCSECNREMKSRECYQTCSRKHKQSLKCIRKKNEEELVAAVRKCFAIEDDRSSVENGKGRTDAGSFISTARLSSEHGPDMESESDEDSFTLQTKSSDYQLLTRVDPVEQGRNLNAPLVNELDSLMNTVLDPVEQSSEEECAAEPEEKSEAEVTTQNPKIRPEDSCKLCEIMLPNNPQNFFPTDTEKFDHSKKHAQINKENPNEMHLKCFDKGKTVGDIFAAIRKMMTLAKSSQWQDIAQCKICGLEMKTKQQVLRHLEGHAQISVHFCRPCNVRLKSSYVERHKCYAAGKTSVRDETEAYLPQLLATLELCFPLPAGIQACKEN